MPNLKPTETWFAFSQVLVNLPFLEDHKKRGGGNSQYSFKNLLC